MEAKKTIIKVATKQNQLVGSSIKTVADSKRLRGGLKRVLISRGFDELNVTRDRSISGRPTDTVL
jgi:hypothetical protein